MSMIAKPSRDGSSASTKRRRSGHMSSTRVAADADADRRLEEMVFGGDFLLSSGRTQTASRDETARRRVDKAGEAGAVEAAAFTRVAWTDDDPVPSSADGVVSLSNVARMRKLRPVAVSSATAREEVRDSVHTHEMEGLLAGAHARITRTSREDNWATAAMRAQARRKRARPTNGGRAAGESTHTRDHTDDDEDEEHEDEDEEEEGDDDAAVEAMLQTAARVSQTPAAGSSSQLACVRVRDLNREDPCRAVVQALAFHPSGSVCAVGALDKRLRFFRVDGKRNAVVASVHFNDMPIASTQWCGPGAREIVVTGRRPFFYVYDVDAGSAAKVPRVIGREERSLESLVHMPPWLLPEPDALGLAVDGSAAAWLGFLGNDGNIVLCSSRTKTWVANLKMNGTVRAATFALPAPVPGDSRTMSGAGFADILSTGSEGEVYRWDLRTMRCISRFADEGSIGGTALAAAPNGRTFAVGSTTGIINIYDAAAAHKQCALDYSDGDDAVAMLAAARASSTAASPRPLHALEHLTTSVSLLTYNHDSTLLLTASQRQKDALRIVSVGTGRAFGNWPSSRTPIAYASAAEFSPSSRYVAIGNDRGRVLLYRLTAFPAL